MYIYDEENNRWIKLNTKPGFKKKKRFIRDIWIFIASIMLFLTLLAVIVLAILTTFVSFSYLDESDYSAIKS